MIQSASTPRTSYTQEILRLYARLGQTPGRPRTSDRLLAAELERQQVPLDLVRAAFTLATARRAASLRPLPPIRSLHYFLPVLEELKTQPVDPDYLEHLEHRRRTDAPSADGG